ncbi:MAG: LuxR C-terminal-related transcriptional regulator [Anaerolineaceae bacterium]|nr:LuxR C-terminal-related transcriptional regulator [Anaerolineaceae bacterium]
MNDLENTPLSERELEILRLVAHGKSNKEIALELYISINTVKVHLAKIFQKINVSSRTEATLYAIEHEHVASPKPAYGNGVPQNQEPRVELLVPPTVTVEKTAPRLTIKQLLHRYWWALGIGLLSILFFSIAWAKGWIFPQPTPDPILAAMSQERWKELAPMSEARANMAVAVYDNKIYVIGGETEEGITGLTEVYDIATDTWSRLPDKPTPVTDAKAVVVGGKIYVAGRRKNGADVASVMEIYNPSSQNWLSFPINIEDIEDLTFFSHENLLYLGVSNTSNNQRIFSLYSSSTTEMTWKKISTLYNVSGECYAVKSGNSILLIGIKGSEMKPISMVFSPSNDNSLSIVDNLNSFQSKCVDCSYMNLADYIIGVSSSNIFMFDPLSNSISQNTWQHNMPVVFNSGSIAFQNKLYEFGGIGADNAFRSTVFTVSILYTISIPFITTGNK